MESFPTDTTIDPLRNEGAEPLLADATHGSSLAVRSLGQTPGGKTLERAFVFSLRGVPENREITLTRGPASTVRRRKERS
jgi:hypothetical protein